MKPSISVGVLAFNESATIERVVRTAVTALSAVADVDVVVVDDGSTDETGAIADGLASELPCVRVIHHPQNRGIGETLYTIYTSLTASLWTVIPADGEFDVADLVSALREIEPRTLVSFRVENAPPWMDYPLRRAVSFIQRQLNRRILGLDLPNVNWVKIIPADAIDTARLVSRSPQIESEIVLQCMRAGCRFAVRPSNNSLRRKRASGMQTFAFLEHVVGSTLDLLRVARAYRR